MCDMKMSYLRGACNVTRWEGDSNESVYKRCGMGPCVNGVKCGIVECVKRKTLRWCGHIKKMNSEEFMKKMYK